MQRCRDGRERDEGREANEQRRSKQVNERKRIKRERGKTIISANVYALMREGAHEKPKKGNNLIIFLVNTLIKCEYSIHVLKIPIHTHAHSHVMETIRLCMHTNI